MTVSGEPLRFELGWAAQDAPLVNPDLGVERLVTRGPRHSFTSDITLLDTTDHRLLRAGIVLAHRVVDGLGEWYMDAPAWAPWLPVDRSVALDAAGDLPLDFTCLVRPFLRGSPLSAVAALTCERTEVSVLGAESQPLAVIRDDRITVVQSGVTTSRVREVTITPRQSFTPEQREWLTTRVLAMGGAPVAVHPSVLSRLGARAGALSDYPEPPSRRPRSVDELVRTEILTCLRRMLEADLAARSQGMDLGDRPVRRGEPRVVPDHRPSDELLGLGSDPVTQPATPGVHDAAHGPVGGLLRQLDNLAVVLDGLDGVLERSWLDEVDALLGPLRQLDRGSTTVHLLPEPYYRLLDVLVVAARAPRVVGDPGEPARPLLRARMAEAGAEAVAACDAVRPGREEGWARARRSVDHAAAVAGVLTGSRRALRVRRRLERIARDLEGTGSSLNGPGHAEVVAMSPQAAFDAGRELERRIAARTAARSRFVAAWPRRRAKLEAALGTGGKTGAKAGPKAAAGTGPTGPGKGARTGAGRRGNRGH